MMRRAAILGLSALMILAFFPAGASFARAGEPDRVIIDLAGCDFIVEPGEPGSGFQVVESPTGRRIKESRKSRTDRSGRTLTRIRVRPENSFGGRMKAAFTSAEWENPDVTVRIPRDMPMELDLRVRRGESRIDLGGLDLRGLRIELTSGEFDVAFPQPVARPFEFVRIRASRGDFHVHGLANLRASEMLFRGSMGDFNLDFDGEWTDRSTRTARLRGLMGDLDVRVPKEVVLVSDESPVAQEPSLDLEMRMTIGSSSVRRR